MASVTTVIPSPQVEAYHKSRNAPPRPRPRSSRQSARGLTLTSSLYKYIKKGYAQTALRFGRLVSEYEVSISYLSGIIHNVQSSILFQVTPALLLLVRAVLSLRSRSARQSGRVCPARGSKGAALPSWRAGQHWLALARTSRLSALGALTPAATRSRRTDSPSPSLIHQQPTPPRVPSCTCPRRPPTRSSPSRPASCSRCAQSRVGRVAGRAP